MVKPRPGRLKVFRAQFGFYDSVVAAPSQAAALRAWGTHQNLFSEGLAAQTDDAAAVEAALAHAYVPLRRALGSNGRFEVEPTGLPVMPDLPKQAKPRIRAKAAPRPRPDRSRLDAAERAVNDLDADWRKEEADIAERVAALRAQLADARDAYRKRRDKALKEVSLARDLYRKTGGQQDD